MTTVPVTVPSAGSASTTVFTSGSGGDVVRLAVRRRAGMEAAGLGAIVDRDRHVGERHGLGEDEQPHQPARPRVAAARDDIGVCIAVGHLIIAGGQAGDVNRGRSPGACASGEHDTLGALGAGLGGLRRTMTLARDLADRFHQRWPWRSLRSHDVRDSRI